MIVINKKIIFYVISLIGITSIILKISLIDFSLPVSQDNIHYVLHALSFSNDDYSVNIKKNPGWPLFVSFFYRFVELDNFLDYSNLLRLLAVVTSTLSIIPMYFVSRKFFNAKYSLVGCCLVAFEPHLIYNSSLGLSESLSIPIAITTFYFILSKNLKFQILSFIFTGLCFWIRIEGIFLIIIISIIYFIINKKSIKLVLRYFLLIGIFILVISPIFYLKNLQYDEPLDFYYGERLFVENYKETGIKSSENSFEKYIENYGVVKFIEKFILYGSINLFDQLFRILMPYLLPLLIIGAFFSIRPFDQNSKFIKGNWVLIISYCILIIVMMGAVNERRYLFILLPFLSIFANLAIFRITEYGLSTFSFTDFQKNLFLLIFVSIILLSSTVFIMRYSNIDNQLEMEQIEFASILKTNLDGDIFDISYARTFNHGFFHFAKLNQFPNDIKNFNLKNDILLEGIQIKLFDGNSLDELFEQAKLMDVKYIILDQDNNKEFLNDLYAEKIDVPYLKKIYDTEEEGMKIIKIKVFLIDHLKYNPNN